MTFQLADIFDGLVLGSGVPCSVDINGCFMLYSQLLVLCYGCYILKYNYCLFLNTKVFVVWLPQISEVEGCRFECSLCTIFGVVW
jgi:hypothetical protein